MSNVIQFLEKIATSAMLMDNDAWKQELNSMDIDPELKLAFENKDQATIEKFLGTDTNLMSIMFPADDDAPSEDTPSEDSPSDDGIRRAG